MKRDLFLAVAVPFALLAPFCAKAFHIDDPVYLWVAHQILEHPLDFYGFEANWYGVPEAMYLLNYNPPGVGYFLAGAALIFGWGEIGLHLAMAALASSLSLAIYLLARCLTRRPLLAVFAAILTPMFVVTGTTLMTDVPTVALYVWAITLWVYGIRNGQHGLLFAAACCMTLSPLFKYPGLTAVPLLFAYTLMEKRKIGPWAAYFVMPLAGLALYQFATHALYGTQHVLRALDVAVDFTRSEVEIPMAFSLLTGISFVGGSIVTLVFMGPMLWNRRAVVWIAGLSGAFAAAASAWVLWANAYVPGAADLAPVVTPLFIVQSILFLIAGAQVGALMMSDLVRKRDAESLLLFLWIGGTFVLATVINWSVTVRILLPVLAPVAILVARRLDDLEDRGRIFTRGPIAIALALSAVVALSIGWADYRLAAAGKMAAVHFASLNTEKERSYFFQGHWGFQYYMQEHEMAYFDERVSAEAGDFLVIPENASEVFHVDEALARVRDDMSFTIPAQAWAATLEPRRGAGFYTSMLGPLPYAFCVPPPETYHVYEFLAQNDSAP